MHTQPTLYTRGSQPFLLLVPLCQVRAFLVPPKKLRYILLYKRYISCSVTQGSSYPLMFNLVPLGGTSTPGWEPLLYTVYMKCSPFCANPAYHQIYEQSRLGDV